MLATIILSILIFGSAGFAIYRIVKGKGHCEDCGTSCNCAIEPKKAPK